MTDVQFTHLPYCVKRLSDGRHVILNRRYKPVGMITDEWVDYGPYAIRFKRLLKPTIGKISWRGEGADWEPRGREAFIWLYNDGCTPRSDAPKRDVKAYLDRLAALMRLNYEPAPGAR